jgi:hypothetical protein
MKVTGFKKKGKRKMMMNRRRGWGKKEMSETAD